MTVGLILGEFTQLISINPSFQQILSPGPLTNSETKQMLCEFKSTRESVILHGEGIWELQEMESEQMGLENMRRGEGPEFLQLMSRGPYRICRTTCSHEEPCIFPASCSLG